MFISKNELETLQAGYDVSKQAIKFLFSVITILMRKENITPQELTELLEFKDPAHRTYTDKMLKILNEKGIKEAITEALEKFTQ